MCLDTCDPYTGSQLSLGSTSKVKVITVNTLLYDLPEYLHEFPLCLILVQAIHVAVFQKKRDLKQLTLTNISCILSTVAELFRLICSKVLE